ncbi:MAG TPA: DUF3795 domain-containing protein [Petrotogaceae bacterium]|jgi:hypothetical protein|nr:DUF3795 domain-containing protein [Petrotogaceae bacterium]HQI79358.1 DUF3795 domain-containing protein [Petrotogaceae bacterium]
MEKIIACCGLICDTCDAFKATSMNDDVLREETAKKWGGMYGTTFKTKDINCLGCHSNILFGYCNSCDIRACSKSKSLNNCGECKDFTSCEKITKFMDMVPSVKPLLDQIHNSIK